MLVRQTFRNELKRQMRQTKGTEEVTNFNLLIAGCEICTRVGELDPRGEDRGI